MNKGNLLKMAEVALKVPAEAFEMSVFEMERECRTVGCIIGYSTKLDLENFNKNFVTPDGNRYFASFASWSEQFTDLNIHSGEWRYLFSPSWADTDNTPEGAAKRIRYFVKNGLPDDWLAQIEGDAPLSYQ